MIEYEQKRKVQRVLYSKTASVILLVLMILAVKALYDVWRKEQQSAVEESQISKEVSDLQGRSDDLGQKITKLGTERGVEEEIRDKFSVAKEGENVLVIVGTSAEPVKPPETASIWKRMWASVMSVF